MKSVLELENSKYCHKLFSS